ncbi:MAG: hypothetical protein A2068_01535 [Ignavibacteria bacterium GWB2_35_6b]|nr:MAG: hypothetical protein A2068_01535 [Ignavibacteria bacterium GWB2_35_6b]
MDKERFRELCAAYFLDDINDQELKEIQYVLDSGDKELIKIFIQFQKIYTQLPLTAESKTPPAKIKENIFKSINKTQQKSISAIIIEVVKARKLQFTLAFSVLLIISVIQLSYIAIHQNKTIIKQKNEIVELKSSVEQTEAILQVIGAKQFEVIVMNGLSVNPNGYGKIMWDADKKTAVLQISNLPPTLADKDYQLWVIKDNKPESNGVFSIKQGDEKFFKVTNLVEANRNKITAFAVTLEPKGGVPQPTGEMYLIGAPSPSI